MLRKLILSSLLTLLAAISSFGQGGNTTVTAIVKDPTGALYTNSQVNITFVEPTTPGKIPLLNGSTFQKAFTIFATDSFGRFTISLPDTGIIDSSSGTSLSQWSFRVIFSDRATSFVYVTPINCATNIPTTCSSGTMDITTQLQAVAALLPSTGGGGGGPPAGTIPMSAVSFTPTPVFAATANAGYSMTLTGNVSSSSTSGSPINGNILAFNLCQDGTGSRSFAFPGNFIIPSDFTFKTAPNKCNYLAFKYDLTNWTFITDGDSGGSGSTPAPPNFSVQYDANGILGAASLLFKPANNPCSGLVGVACDDYILPSGNVCLSSTEAADANITFGNVFSMCNSAANTGSGGISGAIIEAVATSRAPAVRALPFASVAVALGPIINATTPNATGIQTVATDDPLDVSTGPATLYAVYTGISLTRASGSITSAEGIRVNSPFNNNTGGGPAAETVGTLYGVHVLDQLGKGSTQTAALKIDSQTGAANFAIKVDGGKSQFDGGAFATFFSSETANPANTGIFRMVNGDVFGWRNFANTGNLLISTSANGGGNIPADGIAFTGPTSTVGTLISAAFISNQVTVATAGVLRLASTDPIDWRNNANSGNLALSKNASDNLIWPNSFSIGGTLITGAGSGTATLPANTGTIAELNLSQTFTAVQHFTPSIAVPDGGTGGTTFTTNGIIYGNGASALGVSAAGGAGTLCFVETNGGVPTWASCAGSASTSWSLLTNPSGDLSLAMGANNSLFTSGVITGTRNAWEYVDGASTSTGSLYNIHTGATSTLKPLTVTAVGTSNGIQVSTAGILAPLGTGHVRADQFTGLTVNQLVTSDGANALLSVAGSTTGTNPILKLQPSNAANTALILDTAATPTGDVLDINLNGVKTSWFDSLAFLHTPQATFIGTGAFALSGSGGTCPAAVPGAYTLCLGDTTSQMALLSDNGGTFKPVAQISTSSPTAHGVGLASTTAPQINFASAGTSGNAFISGGAGADGAYGQLDLANANSHTGILPPANGGTGAASLLAANIMIGSGAFTSGHCLTSGGSNIVTDSGVVGCGSGGGSISLDTIIAAAASRTINNTTFSERFNYALTGSTTAFIFGEGTAATGANNIILEATTAASSTAVPFQADNNGNGYKLSSTGLWQPLGTGALATPGAAHNLVVSQAGSTAVTYVAPVGAGKVLLDNGPGNDPSFGDPVTSGNQAAATTQTITATGAKTGVAVSGIGTVLVTVSGTYAGVAFNFEATPDGTFTPAFPVNASQMDSASVVSATGALPSNTTRSWLVDAAGFTQLRVNATAYTSGTANITITPFYHQFVPWTNATIVGTVPVSGTVTTTPPSNASTNLAQVAGTTTDTNSGNKSAGTLRVVLATDQPALTNKLLVTPDSVALPANQSVNVNQINSVTPLMGNGVTGTGSQRVTIASDNTAFSVNASDVGTLADDGAASGTNRLATLPAIEQSQLPAAGTAGRNSALRTDLNRTLVAGQLPINITTYRANKLGLASAASATDIAVMPGNATNTVIVTGVRVSCTQTTAGIIDLALIQRTTADTGGTSAGMTAVKMDTGNGSAVSAPLSYTANPTINSTIGNYDSVKLACLAPATAGAADIYIWRPSMGQSIVLRGTAQQLAVNLNTTTVTGGSFSITFEWIETTGL